MQTTLLRAAVFAVSAMALTRPSAAQRQAGLHGGGGLTVYMIEPRGDFAHHVRTGGGFSLHGGVAERSGVMGLSAAFENTWYGFGSHDDTTTNRMIRSLELGPQLMVPVGPVRPYVSLRGGLTYFGTEISEPCRCYRASCNCDDENDRYGSKTRYLLPRFTWGTARSVGVLVPITTPSAGALQLDLRFTRRETGVTDYYASRDGSQVRGAAAYRVYSIGVTYSR